MNETRTNLKAWIRRALAAAALAAFSMHASAGGLETDKRAHLAGGVLAGGIGVLIADHFVPKHRLLGGIVLGILPGLAIEIGDSTNEAGFSSGDLLADVVGAVVGAVVTDEWLLKSVIETRGNGNKLVGVSFERKF